MSYFIELHVHTREGSKDSSMSVEELATEINRLSLDGICVTEHVDFRPLDEDEWMCIYNSYYKLKEIFKDSNVYVYPGMEVKVNGEKEYLILGAVIPVEVFNLSWEEAVKEIYRLNAIIIQAHPYRNHDSIDRVYDGIEVLNVATTLEKNNKSRLWLKENINVCYTVGSDAHFVDQVGRGIMVFDEKLDTDLKFVNAIRNKDFNGVIINGNFMEKDKIINY